MTHTVRFIARVAVLVALAAGTPVQAQTPETDALRERAEQGAAEAQYLLGLAYFNGEGVPQDNPLAARWWRSAAEQGHADGQYSLGFMYANGRGVPQDYVQGHMWFNLAASRVPGADQPAAASGRNEVAALMTPEQVAEAQRLAREWDEAHPRNP